MYCTQPTAPHWAPSNATVSWLESAHDVSVALPTDRFTDCFLRKWPRKWSRPQSTVLLFWLPSQLYLSSMHPSFPNHRQEIPALLLGPYLRSSSNVIEAILSAAPRRLRKLLKARLCSLLLQLPRTIPFHPRRLKRHRTDSLVLN